MMFLKKYSNYLVLVILLCVAPFSYAQQFNEGDVLFQVSTIDALMEGVYDGDMTFAELSEKGNIGVGTFNALDGEMIALDGKFYQVKSDGKVYPVDIAQKTPYAVVTTFAADSITAISGINSMDLLKKRLDGLLSSKNLFYVIRVDGEFNYVKTRSVPAQTKPYRPLTEVVKEQSVFEFKNIKGTLVGVWSPAYSKGIGVPGYHMHFISEDRSQGGHLLEVDVADAVVAIDITSDFYLKLPLDSEFLNADLGGDKTAALEKVER